MEKKRSKGVTVFAWISVLGVVGAIHSFLTLDKIMASPIWQATYSTLPNSYCYVAQSRNIIYAIAYLIAAKGLFKLLKWARMYMIIFAIVAAIYNIISLFLYSSYFFAQRPLMMYFVIAMILLWSGIVIYFFTRPKVKEQFK